MATVLGLVNGLLVARLGLPPFIVTLGALTVVFAVSRLYSDSRSYQVTSDLLLFWGYGIQLGAMRLTWGTFLLVGLVALVALGVVLAIVGAVFSAVLGLAGFVLFKVVPVVLLTGRHLGQRVDVDDREARRWNDDVGLGRTTTGGGQERQLDGGLEVARVEDDEALADAVALVAVGEPPRLLRL